MPKLGLLLSETNGRRLRDARPEVDLVLLERTLFDPPRAGAAKRWGAQIRRTFPNAELVPYVWHLISHGTEDGLRDRTSRGLGGDAYAFGHLQHTPEVAQAWQSAAQCYQALEATRVVLRTPAGVSPGAVGRQRIRAFVEARRGEGIETVWEPEGLWEPAQAERFGLELGIPVMARGFVGGRPVRDEHEPDILVGARSWIRVEGMGRRPRLSGDQLDALLDHVELVPDATLVFSGPRALGNLGLFRGEAGDLAELEDELADDDE